MLNLAKSKIIAYNIKKPSYFLWRLFLLGTISLFLIGKNPSGFCLEHPKKIISINYFNTIL